MSYCRVSSRVLEEVGFEMYIVANANPMSTQIYLNLMPCKKKPLIKKERIAIAVDVIQVDQDLSDPSKISLRVLYKPENSSTKKVRNDNIPSKPVSDMISMYKE